MEFFILFLFGATIAMAMFKEWKLWWAVNCLIFVLLAQVKGWLLASLTIGTLALFTGLYALVFHLVEWMFTARSMGLKLSHFFLGCLHIVALPFTGLFSLIGDLGRVPMRLMDAGTAFIRRLKSRPKAWDPSTGEKIPCRVLV